MDFLRSWRKPSRHVFSSLCQILEQQPDIRVRNLAEKRSMKRYMDARRAIDAQDSSPSRPIPPKRARVDDARDTESTFVDDAHIRPPSDVEPHPDSAMPATQASGPSTNRIVSVGSVADPDENSAGGARVWASNEKASDIFANNLLMHLIDDIWRDGITLDWVQGRIGSTVLSWHNS